MARTLVFTLLIFFSPMQAVAGTESPAAQNESTGVRFESGGEDETDASDFDEPDDDEDADSSDRLDGDDKREDADGSDLNDSPRGAADPGSDSPAGEPDPSDRKDTSPGL